MTGHGYYAVKLREYRRSRRLNLNQMSILIYGNEASASRINRMEKLQITISDKILDRITDRLKCEKSDILGDDPRSYLKSLDLYHEDTLYHTEADECTLCWSCSRSSNDLLNCEWAIKGEPVKGWKATPRELHTQESSEKIMDKTVLIRAYTVTECPKYLVESKHRNLLKENETETGVDRHVTLALIKSVITTAKWLVKLRHTKA